VRLRFSLRLVFNVLSFVAAALYLCIVRPTSLANQFVAAIDHQEYEHAKSTLPAQLLDELGRRTGSIDRLIAEVFPREWDDVWKCQRRIIVHVASHSDDSGRHIEWVTDFDLIALPNGLSIRPEEIRIPSSIAVSLTAENQPTSYYDQTLLP
jgi:hypothetical protein